MAIPKNLIAGTTKDGRTLYRTLRWCNRITREFWFTTDPEYIDGESINVFSKHFDVRELPAEFVPADKYTGRNASTFELIENPAEWALKALDAGVDAVACSNKFKAVAA